MDVLNEYVKVVCGVKIVVLGVVYKFNIDDICEFFVLEIIGFLVCKGVEVVYYDFYVLVIEVDGCELLLFVLIMVLDGVDFVVIIIDYVMFDLKEVVECVLFILDICNVMLWVELSVDEFVRV